LTILPITSATTQRHRRAASLPADLRRRHELEDLDRLGDIEKRPSRLKELRDGQMETVIALRDRFRCSLVAGDSQDRPTRALG
jgi:hypothetical protein